jgi:ankyrin repeat protein
MDVPSWVVVAVPLGILLATVFLVWRYIRRGTGMVHRAAANGKLEQLEQLLLADPELLNRTDLVGFTPLQYAATWGQLDAARLLLDRGARLTGQNGWTPLHYAAAEGHRETVELLVERGADVNAVSVSDGSTPLHSAVINGHAAVARFLLEKGALPEAKTKSDWTPCHFAADRGDVETMAVLLDHHADWQALNSGEQNPLELALANGHQNIIEMVRQRQAAGTDAG